jgi:hypothetical protein
MAQNSNRNLILAPVLINVFPSSFGEPQRQGLKKSKGKERKEKKEKKIHINF